MLYLVATPIGNMEDITLRALRILRDVDCIYAEDTRHSGLLLSHFEIKKPLFSCHEHNEAERAAEIAEKLIHGENIAYISDAGMPCISDPGGRLCAMCVREKLPFTVIPGPSASVTALCLSGLPTDRFLFYGFLPRTGRERKDALREVCESPYSVIVYESPNRVYDTLCDMRDTTGGDRRASLVREITKIYEESVCLTLNELCDKYSENAPKGECVIVLDGKKQERISAEDTDELILGLLQSGMKAKDVARQISEQTGVPKNEIYKRVLELKDN